MTDRTPSEQAREEGRQRVQANIDRQRDEAEQARRIGKEVAKNLRASSNSAANEGADYVIADAIRRRIPDFRMPELMAWDIIRALEQASLTIGRSIPNRVPDDILTNFKRWEPYMTPAERGAVCAVLFLSAREPSAEDIRRGQELAKEHGW